jgi:autotransporter passenger strand-loop-strand repeat protein
MTTVSSGTTLTVSAGQTLNGVNILSGGILDVLAGGTITNTLNNTGFDWIYGTAIGTAVTGSVTVTDGGYSIVFGDEQVFSGGNASGTSLFAGLQEVYGGTAVGTIVNWGSDQWVYSGGTAIATIVNGGVEVISGVPLFSHGEQLVLSGGTATNTIVNTSGELIVLSGGVANGATLNGGFAAVSGTARGTIINAGGDLGAGGTVIDTTINSGGTLSVDGGSVTNTTINYGGLANVSAGTLEGTTTIDGGTLEFLSGSVVNGTIDFAGSAGTLIFDDTVISGLIINGFGALGRIDLAANSSDSSGNPRFDNGGSLTPGPSNVLNVLENGNTYNLQFDPSQDFTGEAFELVPDYVIAGGAIDIVLGGLSNVLSDQTVSDTYVILATFRMFMARLTTSASSPAPSKMWRPVGRRLAQISSASRKFSQTVMMLTQRSVAAAGFSSYWPAALL